VRIEWDEFFSAVRPFFSEIEEMKHYEVRHGGS